MVINNYNNVVLTQLPSWLEESNIFMGIYWKTHTYQKG